MIYIGSDHRGFELKEYLKTYLTEKKYEVRDCGNTVKDPDDDYPEFAIAVGEDVAHDLEGKGIVICGSGAGVCISANKVPLIRCAQAVSEKQVKGARNDDDINVLAIGCDLHSKEEIVSFVTTFLETNYAKEARFDRRVKKILAYEEALQEGCCGGCGSCHTEEG